MKELIFTMYAVLSLSNLFAQNKDIEKEIRSLEQMEVKAVLEKDTVTLLKLWDKNFVVNSPNNIIVFAGKNTVDRPVVRNSRTSFLREVEQVIIKGNTVITMGNETVVPMEGHPAVKRRYTNIWMQQESLWKLVARHANVICQSND